MLAPYCMLSRSAIRKVRKSFPSWLLQQIGGSAISCMKVLPLSTAKKTGKCRSIINFFIFDCPCFSFTSCSAFIVSNHNAKRYHEELGDTERLYQHVMLLHRVLRILPRSRVQDFYHHGWSRAALSWEMELKINTGWWHFKTSAIYVETVHHHHHLVPYTQRQRDTSASGKEEMYTWSTPIHIHGWQV